VGSSLKFNWRGYHAVFKAPVPGIIDPRLKVKPLNIGHYPKILSFSGGNCEGRESFQEQEIGSRGFTT